MLRGLSLALSIIRETQISKLTPTHTQWLRMWKLSVGFLDKERNNANFGIRQSQAKEKMGGILFWLTQGPTGIF